MKKSLLTLLAMGLFFAAKAQTGLTQTVLLNAKPNPDGTITLVWPKAVFTGKYNIFKNTSGNPLAFTTPKASALSTDSTWTDTEFTFGNSAEYAVVKVNASNQNIAIGYIQAGNKATEIPSHGSMILVIDSNYIQPLAAEISSLISDLETNGYPVYVLYAGRNEKPDVVKDRIKAIWETKKPTPDYLYLLGHIPVPYSGNFTGNSDRCAYPPDGHVEGAGNHTGAWPADVFYTDFEGIWTDNTVNTVTGALTRHHNIPGDGKYDQCAPASPVVMKMGRVDLFNMPLFNSNDTILMKQYLNRVHSWKINGIAFVRRGLVDDNFTSLDLSSTGYNTLASCVSLDSVFQRDYFTSQNAGNYLWSYGCGAGSYTSCSGVGGSNNFNPGIFKNIFTSLAGSYFGDWDAQNSFLRAPLCAGSLLNFWGGIPKWYNHYFGLGKPMGYCAQITQNSTTPSFNYSQNKVHIDLMGDPTLTLNTVPPAGKLTAVSIASKVNLSWVATSGTFDGYVVYRIDTTTNYWIRLNPNILTTTTFVDAVNWNSGKYKYAVRTIRLETSGSGSYYVLGGGSFAWVNHINHVQEFRKIGFTAQPNPGAGKFTLNFDRPVSDNALVQVSDITGRNILASSVMRVHSQSMVIDLTGQSTGIYFVTVSDAAGSGTIKVQIGQ